MALAQRSLTGGTVKLVPDVPVPPGPVTVMRPVVTPAGALTVIRVSEFTTKPGAAVPLKATAVTPVKLVPVKVTTVPAGPAAGENEVITGAGTTVKLAAETAEATPVVTPMGPVVAPAGTVAVSWVAEFTVNVGATVPLNVTRVAPVRSVPVMTTTVPTGPVTGVKLVMVGGVPTVNGVAEVAMPPGVVTLMGPVVTPAGALTVICVAEFTTKPGAAVPLKATAVAPVKFVPVIVTTVPARPPVGVKLVMVGGWITVKLVAEAVVLMGVVTPMGPVVAPAGTVAVSWVAEFTVNVGATVPLKRTCVAPVRSVPVMTTTVPTGPVVGVKLVMVGGKPTKNGVAEVAVPVGAVMVMRPVVLPAATIAVS